MSATKRWRLIEVVSRAGEGASSEVLSEETDTTEAIHSAAHPGRHTADEDDAAESAPVGEEAAQ